MQGCRRQWTGYEYDNTGRRTLLTHPDNGGTEHRSRRLRAIHCGSRRQRPVTLSSRTPATKSTKPSGGSRVFAGYSSEGATFGSMPNRRLPRSPPSPARQASLCREIHQAEWRQPGVCWISQRRRRCRGRCRTVVCREVRRVQRGRPASDTKSA